MSAEPSTSGLPKSSAPNPPSGSEQPPVPPPRQEIPKQQSRPQRTYSDSHSPSRFPGFHHDHRLDHFPPRPYHSGFLPGYHAEFTELDPMFSHSRIPGFYPGFPEVHEPFLGPALSGPEVIDVHDSPSFYRPGRYIERRMDGRDDLPPMEVIVHPPTEVPQPRIIEECYSPHFRTPISISHRMPMLPPPLLYEEHLPLHGSVSIAHHPIAPLTAVQTFQSGATPNIEIEYRESFRYPDGRVETRPPRFDYVDRNTYISGHPELQQYSIFGAL